MSDDTLYFSEGLAAVSINDKAGFIDKTGKMVIPAVYDAVNYDYCGAYEYDFGFGHGKAGVYLDGEWIVIDRHGNELVGEDAAFIDEDEGGGSLAVEP